MAWDAFISYRTSDRPWAKRLHEELTKLELKTFYDYESLVAGTEWEPQLESALADSAALVVLWSTASAEQPTMSWTEQERYLFGLSELRSPRARRRPVIFVLLDEDPKVLGATQHVPDLKDDNVYPGDPSGVPQLLWDRVRNKVRDGIDGGRGVVRVNTLVLSARRQDFTPGALGQARWDELGSLLARLGLAAEPGSAGGAGALPDANTALARRYGENARDWCPYGADSVDTLLTVLAGDFDDAPRIRFESVDGQFATNSHDELQRAAKKLSRELALVIVDPLSLYDRRIETRVSHLAPCFRSPINAFVVPSLARTDDQPLNDFLENSQAASLFRSFFRPPIPYTDDQPSVGLHVRNSKELVRILLLAMGRMSMNGPRSSGGRHPITDWGR